MKPAARRKARRLALQAIYQWQMSGGDINKINTEFCQNCNPKKVDIEYFSELVTGVVNKTKQLDKKMQPILDRPITEINPVELAILRIAIYELMFRLDVPFKVVINEALELAKIFGAEASFKYINGILDKIAQQQRKTEQEQS